MKPLTEHQRRAWNRIGDVLVPGGQGMPSFSEAGVVSEIETALEPSPPEDRDALVTLVLVLAWVPRPLLALALRLMLPLRRVPGLAGAPFRLLDMGLRGVVYTVYYAGVDAGNRVHGGMDCHIHCEPGDREEG